ncbi:MAG: ATP-binding protein [Lacisediminihabitans sp.]
MSNVEPIAKERDRLLHRSARFVGLGSTVVALVCFSVPGILPWPSYLATLPLFALLIFSLYRLAVGQAIVWTVLGLASGLAILVVAQIPNGASQATALSDAMVPLAGAALASFAIVLTNSIPRVIVMVVGAGMSFILVQNASPSAGLLAPQALSTVVGWILAALVGYWLGASVPRAARRIFNIGRAHRAERQASETEAQRRQGARLLHDTVLATLTLLAHSGVGVTASALQQQAGDDARLLRQLRLGANPVPQSSGTYNLEPVQESILGTTLESVKQRFGRMGLEVSWHGTGQVLLPSDVLDAFLLALAECLENVRRHAGVTDAHVTITDDETTVRAMVTDAGVGFDLKDIDAARLGFKDSVVGRLKEVGGNARLFSARGSGTTVVLEVPK